MQNVKLVFLDILFVGGYPQIGDASRFWHGLTENPVKDNDYYHNISEFRLRKVIQLTFLFSQERETIHAQTQSAPLQGAFEAHHPPKVKPIVELQQVLQRIPELIIVGIGYPVASYAATVALRGRDLTHVELTPEQKAGDDYPFEDTGGGPQFLDFILHEVIPLIDRDFRTDQYNKALAGYSLSATFALHVMFQQPGPFQHVIAISPGIEDILDVENGYAKTHSSLPVTLFLGMESPLDEPGIEQWIERGRHFVEMISQRKYAGLEAKFHVFKGTDHVSVGPIAFTNAIRELYR